MNTFVVISLGNPAVLNATIPKVYPGNNLALAPTAWLVADSGTSKDVSDKLKITAETPGAGPSGSGVVFAISGYFGAANPAIWEFIQKKA